MPRGELFGADLRKCFVPKFGNVFIIADLCQIEPRILAWLIADDAFLSLVRSGVDIYEAHARSTMGYSDPSPLKEVDLDKRSLAKARVLGLGYGCGPQKFVTVAKNFGGIDISFADAKKTVADFRSKNPKISRLWNQLDRDFKRSAGSDYSIELPSGRALRYFNVAKTPRGYYTAATEKGGVSRSLYGGLLTENLVQATARDLFAHHLLEINRYLSGVSQASSLPKSPVSKGGALDLTAAIHPLNSTLCHHRPIGRVVFHVHDEVIVEVPKEQASEAEQRILEIMSTTPEWLEDCPVAAKTGVFTHYTK
jgi:DNA polymerase